MMIMMTMVAAAAVSAKLQRNEGDSRGRQAVQHKFGIIHVTIKN